jgi:GGDEF domain-containing protein
LIAESDEDPTVLKARFLDAIRRFNETGTRSYRLSASIGVIHTPPTDITSLDELLTQADELMYADKKAKPGSDIAV